MQVGITMCEFLSLQHVGTDIDDVDLVNLNLLNGFLPRIIPRIMPTSPTHYGLCVRSRFLSFVQGNDTSHFVIFFFNDNKRSSQLENVMYGYITCDSISTEYEAWVSSSTVECDPLSLVWKGNSFGCSPPEK
jgi:hypothetical protein